MKEEPDVIPDAAPGPTPARRHGPSLVVGIGASAGGLDALCELFSALPSGDRMAFVVIEHLDPSGKNLVPEILARVTPIKVTELRDLEPVAGDHIYVAPAAHAVEIVDDVFRLNPLSEMDRRAPIDVCFRSLAAGYESRAVGIILSGAGSDGTVGVQAIANAGGVTMVQAPETARFDSMPRSAVATAVVDHVLPPADLAQELRAYVRHVADHTDTGADASDPDAVTQALGEICDLLQKHTDHNFKHYKTSTLVRRIQRRMQVLRIAAVEGYVQVLRGDEEEVTCLFRELLIGVTAFFRDREAFEALTTEVLRPMLEQRRGDPVRCWVPGCATGEEAYSLAILVREILEKLPDPPEVQIFATDIDERALSTARQGIYPAGIAEDVSPERLERFFVKRGKRLQIAKEIRELCLFSPHNLINDPPFSRLDLISCRNLLIYFGSHLQKKLIPLFHYALRPNGYLFLGPSENISAQKELFVPVDARHRISQRKSTGLRSSSVLPGTGSFRALRPFETAPEVEPDLHQVMQRILLDEFAPKSVIVTEEGQILCASGDMQRYLTVTEGTFQNNVIRLARPGLRVGLRAALSEATKIRRKVVHDKVSVQVDAGIQRVRLTVQPMPRLGEETELFMVVFQDIGLMLPRDEARTETVSADADSLIEQLERELSSTREDLEKTIQDLEAANEELKSSNEELLSMNEELQSANEELETSKEEVQASNEALARAHANLANLLTSTAIATIFLDDERNIQSFTPAAADIYNLLQSDVGRPLAHITHRAKLMPELPSPAQLSDRATPLEHDVVTLDDRRYLRRSLPYRTHEGRAEGMVVTFIDVTELKRAEESARRHERQLRLITDAMPVLISYLDHEHRYRFNNRAFVQWFNMSRDELYGRHVGDVIGPEAFADMARHLARVGESDLVRYETELTHRKGTRIVQATYIADRTSEGELRGYFSLINDITEQRNAGQALAQAKLAAEEANRAKSDFLANMSHEIRTPMTAILGYAELLQTHVSDPDNVACVEAIKRNGQHLIEVINDILDLSKIEAGMLAAEHTRVAPGAILHDVVDSLRVRAEERGLTLELHQEGPLPATITSDPTRLRQILINLVGNAIKFTNEGGVRVVSTLRPGARLLEVRVVDTGIGMSEDQQRLVFEPFRQADTSVTRQYGGTGLGLAISRRLVKLLGGTLTVESTLGRGSTFTFTVDTGPLEGVALVESQPALPAPPPPTPRQLGRQRILVVDDRRDMRYLVQTFLEEAGATVASANDGMAAVGIVAQAIARGEPFDSIVLDMQMPTMDGYEAAARLRRAGHVGLILALTASAMKGDRERCLAAGCDQYLAKPVDRVKLIELLARDRGASTPVPSRDGRSLTPTPLPRPREPGGANGGGNDAAGSGTSKQPRRRVLLVDDNEDSVESLAMLLELDGFVVRTARDGASAIREALRLGPDVVVADLGLPDMNGTEVIGRLKALPEFAGTVFVALSGRGEPEDLRRSREAGFHRHFVKPPALDDLRRTLDELVPGTAD